MTDRRCANKRCGKVLPPDTHPARDYCDERCRSGAHNPVPGEGGRRWKDAAPAMAALVALGGRATSLRVMAKSGLTATKLRRVVDKWRASGEVKVTEGEAFADWTLEVAREPTDH